MRASKASTIWVTSMYNQESSLSKKILITVVGPTAVGKTALSIKLANYFECPILSADSRQFFKEMSIGTAKPTPKELAQAEHHFVDFLSVKDEYSAGKFERDCLEKLDEIFEEKDVAILSGGSGLYVNAVLLGFDDLPKAPEIRNELMSKLDLQGLPALFEQLKALDPSKASRVDPNNMQRVVRALEVCLATGKPYSSFTSSAKKKRPFTPVVIGLTMDRSVLYDRINSRVDQMVDQGLVEEVKNLLDKKNLNALNTVGYKELFDHFDGKKSLEASIDEIKQSTRRFAKRQMTWFKRMDGINWFDPLNGRKIIDHIESEINE